MVEFLRGQTIEPPRAVAGAPEAGDVQSGFVVPSFERGSLVLRDERGKFHRLAWEPREGSREPDERRRALAPGKYVLTGYRIVRNDARGTTWHVSATALTIRTLVVERGRELRVAIDETIHVAQRFDGASVGMAIRGEAEAGLSIYASGKRIPMSFRVRDAAGRELKSGKINYG